MFTAAVQKIFCMNPENSGLPDVCRITQTNPVDPVPTTSAATGQMEDLTNISETVHDLVMSKFNATLKRYQARSLKRYLRRANVYGMLLYSDDDNSTLIRTLSYNSDGSTLVNSEELVYDSQEFLRIALGSEYDKYNTTLSSVDLDDIRPATECSAEPEIVSECNSTIYSFFPQLDEILTSAEEPAPNPIPSQTQKLHQLIKRSLVSYQNMVQASKALHCIESSKEFTSGVEHIEAERLLLLSTCEREAVNEELAKVSCTTTSDDCKVGTVFLSKLFFPGMTFKRNDEEFTRWYVCVVTCGVKVFATTAVKANHEGQIVFPEEFKFEGLSSDFQIEVSLYCMKVKNATREDSRSCLKSLKKLFALTRSSRSTVPFPNDTRTTSFILFCKAVIKIEDLNRNIFHMHQMPPGCLLQPVFRASFRGFITFPETFSGFLNIGKETTGGIVWNHLWCSLEGKLVKCFTYPVAEADVEETAPVEVLDLSDCVMDVVRPVSREICARARTLLLEIMNDGHVIHRFLSAPSPAEMQEWQNKLNFVLSTLKSWKCC